MNKEIENLNNEDDVLRDFTNAIVIQAVEDWRSLCRKLRKTNDSAFNGTPAFSFTTIRQFFKGDWCALLCGKANPLQILAALECERQTVINEISGGLKIE